MFRFVALEVKHEGAKPKLVRGVAPRAGTVVTNHFTVVSPGTERAFALGLNNTPAAPGRDRWPYRPGYSASGVTGGGRRVAYAGLHASRGFTGEYVGIPRGVDMRDAAFTTIGRIAIQALRPRPKSVSDVTVVGQGMLGVMISLVAARMGLRVISYPTYGYVPTLTLGDHKFVVEAAGTKMGFALAIQCLAPGGGLVIAGSHRAWVDFDLYSFHKKRASMIGAWAGGASVDERRADEEHFLWMLSKGLDISPAIGEVVSWRDATWAYSRMLERKTRPGALVIDWRGAK